MTSTDIKCSGLWMTTKNAEKIVLDNIQGWSFIGEVAAAYRVISGGETASELLQPDTGLLQHVRVLMALKL